MDIEKLAAIAQDRLDRETAENPDIRKMIGIVEDFIQANRVMCYGGTAINNLLPEEDQFYNSETDVPDYDFYSETPQLHAMVLADKFSQHGYTNIEVKPGAHLGTWKVFVDYTGIADITALEKPIFEKLWKEQIVIDDIHYVTPNFLRLSMYLELSRPRGDVSRWTKVYKRLMLLNKHYPVSCPLDESRKVITESYLSADARSELEDLLMSKGAMLLGMNAAHLHSKDPHQRWSLPLDVLVTPDEFDATTESFAKILEPRGKIKIDIYPAYAELLPRHADVTDSESGALLVRVFETMACHSYHEMKDGLRVASIPTLLQFFFSFLYADAHFLEGYDENRIVCVAQRLVDLAHASKGKHRFSILTPLECMGKQESLFDMREHASKLRAKTPKDSPEFLRYFFAYKPTEVSKTQRRSLRSQLRRTLKHRPMQGEKSNSSE
jgi:hypothetical protein